MIKILFIKANPKDTVNLHLDNEENAIRDLLQMSDNKAKFEFEARGAVSTTELHNYLESYKPNILHISSHGSEEEGIFFQDDEDFSQEVSVENLSAYLKTFTSHLRFVFLNSCHSLSDINQVNPDGPCILGMKKEVPNDMAMEFSSAFYSSFFNGKEIEKAFATVLAKIGLAKFNDTTIPEFIKTSINIVFWAKPPDPIPDGGVLVTDDEINGALKICKRNMIINAVIILIIVVAAVLLVTTSVSNELSKLMSAAGATGPLLLLLLVYMNIHLNSQKRDEYHLLQREIERYKAQSGLTPDIIKYLNKEYKKIMSIRHQIKLPWMN